MKNFLVYLMKIILAILLSSPIAVLIMFGIYHTLNRNEYFRNYAMEFELGTIVFYTIAFYIVYGLMGLPTTLVTDGILKLFSIKKGIYLFFVTFFTYTLVGTWLASGFQSPMSRIDWYVLIPVYTYFIVLMGIRNKFTKNNVLKR